MNKKDFLTVFISTFLTIFLCYSLFFLKIHFKDLHEHAFRFKSFETLNFNKKYYNVFHHLRDINGIQENKDNPENYLFSTINDFSIHTNNVLLQGDSWFQQMNEEYYKKSHELISNFAKKNNFGLINGGINSFSPSQMQLQYEVLEKDFNIKPNIVVAYFDQTDLGDKLCRYKDKRVYDKNNNLVSIKKEYYSRAIADYTKIFYISEVTLMNDSILLINFKLTNFYIKYEFLRFINKIKSIKKHGWKNRDSPKCKFGEIRKYLIKSNDNEISYFEDRVNDYINLLLTKEYIEKIILVTFPHHDHIFGYMTPNNEKKYYTINVSNIIEKISKNNKKIHHLNFSKLISDEKINIEKYSFLETDPATHLKEKYHTTLFIQDIIKKLDQINELK